MRIAVISSLILFLTLGVFGQNKIPVIIKLKNGETIEASHFGQLNCSTSKYFDNSIILKGKYMESYTETKDYSDINKLVLQGFTDDPVASVGNQKGTIIVYKKDGTSVELEEAELCMACYGSIEKYNQLRLQMVNPLTGKMFEKPVAVNEIVSISFK